MEWLLPGSLQVLRHTFHRIFSHIEYSLEKIEFSIESHYAKRLNFALGSLPGRLNVFGGVINHLLVYYILSMRIVSYTGI